jgi:non-specific serine/threonine protein kinase
MSGLPDSGKPALYRYRFGTAEFDEARFELRVAGSPVEVQRKPLEILACLLAHADEVVTKDELLEAVWLGRPTVENVIANAIAKLRSALGAGNAGRILTQPRVGYRFTGPLERIAVGSTPTSSLKLSVGMFVPGRPSFVLESLMDRSGSSEVWTARHAKTRELRVYKFALDGVTLAALKREATLFRVLHASLGERADFARIMDWNFETAPFFLECEYGGQNLADWATGDGRLATMPLGERLGLFLQIADAAVAAHDVGVLHKDLKPGNILVAAKPDGGWQVRLTDFGAGGLLEADRIAAMGITRLGMTITTGLLEDTTSGTPLYLAPELLGGQPPTVQSDLYALGMMLYQLVVGDLRKPLVPGWERDVSDELLREDIAAATDGDRARRLSSVADLAARLRNLESRRAARRRQARADQAAREDAEALQRSRARRPWIAAAMLALAAGLAASLWLYRDAQLATQRSEAINSFLNWDVLANTGALKTDKDPDPTMRRVLREAARTVGDRFANDPDSEGWIRLAIGQGLGGLGDYHGAEEQQRQAIALLQRANSPGHERALAAAHALAMTLLEKSKFAEAEAVLGEVDTLTQSDRREGATVFKVFALRGMLRAQVKQCDAALKDLRIAESIVLPASPEADFNYFNVRAWTGEALNCLGRYADAERIFAALLGPQTDEAVVGPVIMAYARMGRASALLFSGEPYRAESELQQAIHSLESTVGATDVFSMGQALVVAGDFYATIGSFDKASEFLNRGRALLLQIGEQQEKALGALRTLGAIDVQKGRFDAAIAKLTAARAGLATVYGETSPDVQGANYWLAQALLAGGRSGEAAALIGTIRPEALRAALGGSGWEQRLTELSDALHRASAGDQRSASPS